MAIFPSIKKVKTFSLQNKKFMTSESFAIYLDCSPSIKLKNYVVSSTHPFVLEVLSIKISGSGYLKETIGS